jgi:PKD repeat protein
MNRLRDSVPGAGPRGPAARAACAAPAALLFALCACGGGEPGMAVDGAPVAADAGTTRPVDAATGPDAIAPLSWIDFAITGCDEIRAADVDGGTPSCVGPAPLPLRFAAVTPAPVDLYRWSFGDDTGEDTSPSPLHLFTLPGTYDVSLTAGGPGGTAHVGKTAAVTVEPAPLGSRCTVDGQCGADECVCGTGTECPPTLSGGLCASACDADTPCAAGGVCADLAPTDPETPADWQRTLCLAGCDGDDDCPGDLVCGELVNGAGAGWVKGCFAPGLLGGIGAPCRGADGAPHDEACASGLCVDDGARGLCSAACTDTPCPASAACATFGDGGDALCLRRCDGEDACTDDPWLACEPADSGEFTVDETPAAGGYCAPKRCSTPEECGPDGTCEGGLCGPELG